MVCEPEVDALLLLCCELEEEDGSVELGCCCCCVWSWEVLLLLVVPEVDDVSCATANVAASKNVAEVKRMRLFMLPPNRCCPLGVRTSPRR